MENYDDAVSQLQAAGLLVDMLSFGGLVRCKTVDDRRAQKSAWYSLHQVVSDDGKAFVVGAYGDHRTGISGKISIQRGALSAEHIAAMRARAAEDRKRAEGIRKAEQSRAAERAAKIWRECAASGECGYLTTKGIQAHGARFSAKGNLVIPIHDGHSKIYGLQVIYGDPAVKAKKGRDKDYFPPGLAKKGHWFQIGSPSTLCLVAEGFATAASLHQATGYPVAVAFDAGNLADVSIALRKRYKGIRLLICADDDFLTTGNPGIKSASAAALAVDGSWLAPIFAERGERKLTDFNDLHLDEGLHVVREQIERQLEALKWTLPARTNATGGAGAAAWDFSHDALIQQYTLIYGTETVFDAGRHRILSLAALSKAAGRDVVKLWLADPDRKICEPEQVGFDPRGDAEEVKCNLYGGWPSVPKAGDCKWLLELLDSLVREEDNAFECYDWILKWLAYPIQNPGAKMQTAILMHGPEGTGKNTFFNSVRKIYGRYGCSFGQTELESQFNGWASAKLFGLGNEVVTRAELYHQQGRLKSMITEREWMINEKNLPVREEQNHANFVFLSNRIDIAKLDKEDRRYCVIWTPPAAPAEFYINVAKEIENGGIEALHDHLLHLDLGDFNEHSKPPMTRSKRELIKLGMDSTDAFYLDWTQGDLPVPCVPCQPEQIYAAYQVWGKAEGVPKLAQKKTLLAVLRKKPGVSESMCIFFKSRRFAMSERTKSRFFFPPSEALKPGSEQRELTKQEWLTVCRENFADGLQEWANPQ